MARRARSKLKASRHSPTQGDEDDLRRDEILAQASGRDAGDRQRDVGADGLLEESQDREIDDPPPADDGADQRQRDAERPLPRAPDGAEDQVGDEQGAHQDRDRHEHPALGVRVVIVVVVMIMIVAVRLRRRAPRPISSGRYSRCTGWPSPRSGIFGGVRGCVESDSRERIQESEWD